MYKIPFLATLALFTSLPVFAQVSEMDTEIEYLLKFIHDTPCSMIRNGKNYEGAEAVAHVRKKYAYYKYTIKTTEDFIRLSATKSTLSGEQYQVICPNGYHGTTQQWLFEELSRLRRH